MGLPDAKLLLFLWPKRTKNWGIPICLPSAAEPRLNQLAGLICYQSPAPADPQPSSGSPEDQAGNFSHLPVGAETTADGRNTARRR